ncbi:MAG TPA: FAD-dependent oxidoreductase [Pirellulales bacterium]|nr:FAD-dependent oxidoreductase [Pirellulales bacterium]
MTPPNSAVQEAPSDEATTDVSKCDCCVVGGGPAGVMLSLLLARQGISTFLLESHKDFDRDFRGDTIHPSTLEILDQLGLAARLHELPHGKLRALKVHTPGGTTTLVDLHRLRTPFPYIMMLPQARFLDFLATEARRYPDFHLQLGANVQRLVEEGGRIVGVRRRGDDSRWHEVRAPLVVGCDGRFSKLRSLSRLETEKTSPPMDVVWLRLSRRPTDPRDEGEFYISGGHLVVILNREDHVQIGYVILKGGFPQMRASGIETLQKSLAAIVPWLADRVGELQDWKQVSVLSVESSRLPRWYRAGLLLIGDAAHVMTPVGGVGINYAIQDAVETANLLGPALKRGQVSLEDLAAVQHVRERPTRIIQAFQRFMQRQMVNHALEDDKPFHFPLAMRLIASLPLIRDIPARMVAFGPRRVRIQDGEAQRSASPAQ